MEFIMLNREDQQTNSIEHVVDDQTVLQDGRSYECMYCKHGFTNAQALGGHMNVHRKDRAKNRSNSSNNKSNSRQYESCLITTYNFGHQQEVQTQEFMLRSSPTIYDNNFSKYQNPDGTLTSPSREEMRLSLGLQFGKLYEEEESVRGGMEDDELDLELRLGQDPWKCS